MNLQPGTRIRLRSINMEDPPVNKGSEGTITATLRGHVFVHWDCGRSCNLFIPDDTFDIIVPGPSVVSCVKR